MSPRIDLRHYVAALADLHPIVPHGVVTRAIGLTVEVRGVGARIGDCCAIMVHDGAIGERSTEGSTPVLAEVVGFRDDALLLMPLGALHGVQPGSRVQRIARPTMVPGGVGLLGRVLDGMGNPIDTLGPLADTVSWHVPLASPPAALARPRIAQPLETGVRTIDALLTVGVGQRLGIFAGSGVGKSSLLGMIARGTAADVIVIGLVGERGREVQDFIAKNLGEEGLQRAVIVVATSDQPALLRLKAAWMATSIAETFRDAGRNVLLLIDSVTRVAMAQREIGLAAGEPPALRGYTPSVFAILPRLLERAGRTHAGAITGIYTVLVEGDDMNEPVADTVRGVLDGHIVLSRQLAAESLYPAIDVSQSISRTMPDVITPEHLAAANQFREHLAVYERHRDLIAIGAYIAGSNPAVDAAIALMPRLTSFRRQEQRSLESFAGSVAMLQTLAP